MLMSLAGFSDASHRPEGTRRPAGLIDNHLHIIRGGLNFNMELRWDGVRSVKRNDAYHWRWRRDRVAASASPWRRRAERTPSQRSSMLKLRPPRMMCRWCRSIPQDAAVPSGR